MYVQAASGPSVKFFCPVLQSSSQKKAAIYISACSIQYASGRLTDLLNTKESLNPDRRNFYQLFCYLYWNTEKNGVSLGEPRIYLISLKRQPTEILFRASAEHHLVRNFGIKINNLQNFFQNVFQCGQKILEYNKNALK